MQGGVDEQTSGLIVAALRKAILRGKPIRLIQSGKGEGLFPKELEERVREHCFSGVGKWMAPNVTFRGRTPVIADRRRLACLQHA
jgi:hypothetical protein